MSAEDVAAQQTAAAKTDISVRSGRRIEKQEHQRRTTA